jgi:hypothetical protein
MENEIKGDEKKVRPHPTLHHIYQAVLLKFDSIVVAVMLEYVLGEDILDILYLYASVSELFMV